MAGDSTEVGVSDLDSFACRGGESCVDSPPLDNHDADVSRSADHSLIPSVIAMRKHVFVYLFLSHVLWREGWLVQLQQCFVAACVSDVSVAYFNGAVKQHRPWVEGLAV